MHPEIDYHSLPNDPEGVHQAFDNTQEDVEKEGGWSPQRKTVRLHWIVHVGSLATIISLAILLIYSNDRASVATACWDSHNYYSPVNAALETHPYVTIRFNGSLWYESPFKGPPSPVVEEAWHDIMQYGMIAVSASDYERVNHSTRTAVRFPDEAGGGYMATTVGTHQMHCLHYIWQDHHREYYPDVLRKAKDIPELYERHYEHCVDYIRQSLMCHFDVGLVTYDWVLKHQIPTPNSNAMHKCVDWKLAQAWLKERAVDIPEGFEWKQPNGQESLPWNP
ncbi:hypothetical protein K505DRAFT_358272 [Melanomma pulvis-pyrius CBS 109.77]|uniref:Tat pathway signal sequence n=1 Tax=Melanomma pulvis-pyrius CBS 109.77 TaxID=1314802 RepID=A0A6A6XML1_9PLEO|nr:hypothetical protein K505DRAFT_358272 [Melanomma pulvis-pyrius CBS 109.77]